MKYETRLKYYYQAQKDFEARTGKKAYDRVPASLSFADYFRRQPASFKKSWLGAKRYAAYAAAEARGEDKEELLKIFQPSLGYMQTIKTMRGWAKGYDATIEEESPRYQAIAPTFQDATENNLEGWMNDLESKDKDDLNALLEAADKAENDQIEALDNREPKPQDYSDAFKRQKAKDEWVDNKKRVGAFFEKIKNALRRLLTRQQENHHQNADEYLDTLKKARETDMDERSATKAARQASAWASNLANYQREYYDLPKAKEEIDELQEQRREKYAKYKSASGDEMRKLNREVVEMDRRIQLLQREYDTRKSRFDALKKIIDHQPEWQKFIALREDRRNQKRNKAIKRSLVALFPDNGGKAFFTKEFRKKAIAAGKKVGCEREAREVLALYDLIGRCYNTGGRTIVEPKNIVFTYDKGLRGAFDPFTGEVQLQAGFNKRVDNLLGRVQFRRTFAHELGHWLEMWALGEEQSRNNAEWLSKELGSAIRSNWKPGTARKLDPKKQPTLGHRVDFYWKTFYTPIKSSRRHRPLTSEIISTAMELICADPEAFARQSPKQFNPVLRNLEKLSDGKSSFAHETYNIP